MAVRMIVPVVNQGVIGAILRCVMGPVGVDIGLSKVELYGKGQGILRDGGGSLNLAILRSDLENWLHGIFLHRRINERF